MDEKNRHIVNELLTIHIGVIERTRKMINPPCLSGCFMFLRLKTLKENNINVIIFAGDITENGKKE